MKTGVFSMNTDEGFPALDLARLVEDNGIESLFVPDHSHVPARRRDRWAGPRELYADSPSDMPREYFRNYDQLISIAAMCAVTSTLRLGTGICVITQRDPIYLAKQTATIDHMSAGRLIFGVGAGAPFNSEELRNHGTNPSTRTALMLERLAAIKQIWANDLAEFHGKHVDFDHLYSWPKPIQMPHPPILMGGDGPTVLDRVLSHADGWFPGHNAFASGGLGDRIAELRERAASMGRSVEVTLNFGHIKHVDEYVALAPDRVVYLLPSGSPDDVRRTIADVSRIAQQVTDA